ncbi:MAG: putative quinol monooxygenase [Pacificimonas sp.]|jgi:quinol monooxygenase YgiN|nr:putative quinol monooxygenase [Pacificimonas sp.]
MIAVLGYLHVDPAALDGLLPAMKTTMEKTRAEDGCERYSLAVEDAAEGKVSISEKWRDMDALKAHGAAPHMADFNKALAGKVKGAEIHAYEASNETKLA